MFLHVQCVVCIPSGTCICACIGVYLSLYCVCVAGLREMSLAVGIEHHLATKLSVNWPRYAHASQRVDK